MTRPLSVQAALIAIFVAACLSLPLASAFHGNPYTIVGKARGGVTSEYVPSVLRWSGQGGLEQFTIIIATIPPVHRTFSGDEDVSHVRFEGCLEIVEPYWAWSTDPAVSFWVEGRQTNDLCNNTQQMDYWGFYEEYELDFIGSITVPGVINPPL